MSMPAEPVTAPPAPRVEDPPAPAPVATVPVDVAALVKQAAAEAAERTRAAMQEQLDAANAKLNEISDAEKQRADEQQARDAEAARVAREAEEADLSAKDLILKRDQEWEARMAAMERQNQQNIARMDLERQLAELKAYIRGKIAEVAADRSVHPSFYDYITGSTPEEVDAAIDLARQKTAALFEEYKTGAVQQRAGMPGVSVASGPSSMGSVAELQEEPDYENMDLATYVKNRPNLPPGQVGRNVGMFG
jgi:hypothetical protein